MRRNTGPGVEKSYIGFKRRITKFRASQIQKGPTHMPAKKTGTPSKAAVLQMYCIEKAVDDEINRRMEKIKQQAPKKTAGDRSK
jgi:hypothetical protein